MFSYSGSAARNQLPEYTSQLSSLLSSNNLDQFCFHVLHVASLTKLLMMTMMNDETVKNVTRCII